MLTTKIIVLLVADVHVDQWHQLIEHAAEGMAHIKCADSFTVACERSAAASIGLVFVDAAIAMRLGSDAIAKLQVTLPEKTRIITLAANIELANQCRTHASQRSVLCYGTLEERRECATALNSLLTQARLQAQLQLLTAALEGTTDGLVVIDARSSDSPIVFANTAFSRLTGYALNEILGRNACFLRGVDTDPNTIDALNAALVAGQEFSAELMSYRKDGTPFLNRLGLRPLNGADGQVQYFVATQEDITERRRVSERLIASEARLELAMSASELAMWDWNVSSGEIYYNDQWQALLEIPAEELLLRESLTARLVLPEDDASIYAELERHMSGELARFEREFEVRTSSGKSKSVLARASVVRRDANGQALRVIGVWRDVTARKTSLRTIEETHKRWQRAVAGTSDGLFDWDLVTGYVWYAPRFREQLGYDEHEFTNTFTALQQVLHTDERITVLTRIRTHLEQKTPLDLNCRILGKSGEYKWYRLRGSAERDAAGRPKRLSGSIRDISGQIDAETALHRSEDFYSTILDALPLTVAYIDRTERVIYANKASGILLGRDTELLRGRVMREVLHPELYGQLAAPLAQAFRDEIVECQLRTLDGSGRAMDIDLTFLPHRDSRSFDAPADQSVQGCFLLARDITTRLRLEAELRQSQKMEAIGRLTGGVAHDFNNLLSVTIGNAQLLSRSLKDTPRLYKQADTILRSAMRGAELTRRLLTFARQQETKEQVTKVNDVINGMSELLRRTLPNDIDLRLELDDSVCATKLDQGQFENALLNLAINARDAIPQGGIIRVHSRNVTVDSANAAAHDKIPMGDYAVVTVNDSGTGMRPEILARVFEPFFTTKESGKGSGLGLAMVYSFITGCSGYVRIESKLNVGTQVSLYFPKTHEVSEQKLEAPSVTLDLPRGSEAILVVDHNNDVRATAVEILTSLGYRVYSAGTGRHALAIAENEPQIALVFSDVMLPGGVSANTLINKLRERHPHMKSLLTSGFSDSLLTHRSILDGSIEVLPKPYQLADLARRIRDVLDSEEEKIRVQA